LACVDNGGVTISFLLVLVGDCGKVETMLAVFIGDSVPELTGIDAFDSNLALGLKPIAVFYVETGSIVLIDFKLVESSETIISSMSWRCICL
jgi:hypothetical protein